MDKQKRVNLLRAMETIVRNINEEGIDDGWLMNGVADGDGQLSDDELFESYCKNDDHFSDLMSCFCRTMRYMLESEEFDEEERKNGDGFLYCDGLVSEKNDRWLAE